MARYANLYAEERDAHEETRRQLVHAAESMKFFSEFLRVKAMEADFVSFVEAKWVEIGAVEREKIAKD